MRSIPDATAITLTDLERAELESLARSMKGEHRLRQRARIVLLASDGAPTRQKTVSLKTKSHRATLSAMLRRSPLLRGTVPIYRSGRRGLLMASAATARSRQERTSMDRRRRLKESAGA